MKAPEKLYLRKRNKLPLEVVRGKWYEIDPQNIYGSVEYTRTDVFIGKACVAYCKICDTQECDGTYECDRLAKFRRKLKNELKQD